MSFNFFLFTSLHPSDLLSIPWPMCLVLYFQHLFSKYHALISGDHHYRNEDPFDEVSKDDDQTQGEWTFCKDPKMRNCIKGYFFIHLRNTDVRAAKNGKVIFGSWWKLGEGRSRFETQGDVKWRGLLLPRPSFDPRACPFKCVDFKDIMGRVL